MTAGAIHLTLAYGQSNAENGGYNKLPKSERLATDGIVDTGRALMLNTGFFGTQGEPLAVEDLHGFCAAEEWLRAGESGGSSFLRHSLWAQERGPTVHVFRTSGQAGRRLRQLDRGSTPYNNLVATANRAAVLAHERGNTLYVPHILFDQGEADRKKGTDGRVYRDELVQLARDASQDVQAATGQIEPVWLLTTILPSPSPMLDETSPDISLAQVDALTAGATIAPVCCPYWFCANFGFNPDQAVHWSPRAKAFLREYGAKAARIVREALACDHAVKLGDKILRPVFASCGNGPGRWEVQGVPFETSPRTIPETVCRDGNAITGEVGFAEGGLSFYAGFRPALQNAGFHWAGKGEIDHVEVINTPTKSIWKVVLSEPGSGTLSYALAPSGSDDMRAPMSYGNVFDNCCEPSFALPGATLRQGLLPFRTKIA
jgi:hypothetical protein